MNRISPSLVLGFIQKHKTLQETITYQTYIPIEEKVKAIKEYVNNVVSITESGSIEYDSVKKYIKFIIMFLNLYTNIDTQNEYETYDILQKSHLINEIIELVGGDYQEFETLTRLCFEDKARYFYDLNNK